MQKIYETERLIINGRESFTAGQEGDAANDCIHAAANFAKAFADHLVPEARERFIRDFKDAAITEIERILV